LQVIPINAPHMMTKCGRQTSTTALTTSSPGWVSALEHLWKSW